MKQSREEEIKIKIKPRHVLCAHEPIKLKLNILYYAILYYKYETVVISNRKYSTIFVKMETLLPN